MERARPRWHRILFVQNVFLQWGKGPGGLIDRTSLDQISYLFNLLRVYLICVASDDGDG